ncbi:MAG: hypothetical protein CMD92_09480 [Gammaproteobacteria bacterium]|nr:hypothetical protein [Gammaproteobacteria bacterium]
MSIRRASPCNENSVLTHPLLDVSVAPTGTSISDQLGLPDASPAKPYVPFKPQHPVPRPVGNVVDGVFSGYDAQAIAPALPNWPAPIADTEGMMSNALAKAKARANRAVLKGKALAGKAAAAGKAVASKAAAKTKSAAKAAAAAAGERLSRMGETDSEDEDCDCTEEDEPPCCDDK